VIVKLVDSLVISPGLPLSRQ